VPSRRSFLFACCTFAASSRFGSTLMGVIPPIEPDHIVLGCRDLDEGIAYAEQVPVTALTSAVRTLAAARATLC